MFDLNIKDKAIVIMGCFFSIMETIYFGSNFFPQSPEEAICDGIAILIVAIGLK